MTQTALAMLPALALALPAAAQNVSGFGELLAKDKLAAKGCGRVKIEGLQRLALMPDGT